MSPRIDPNQQTAPAVPTNPAKRKGTLLEAQTISPSLLSGLKGTAWARLTTENDKPLPFKTVWFYYPGTHEPIGNGTQKTDSNGIARVSTGNQVGGIFSHVLTDFAGAYEAEFKGDDEYEPASASGDVNLLPNIIGR
ncbi:Ig-like domain-containing protein [Kitasatospora purpeofusca]|uniref:hypothetical protein n=1 Tax=Kitasatospora purpeofusca TaxID=67352 RepID=UPI00367BB17A